MIALGVTVQGARLDQPFSVRGCGPLDILLADATAAATPIARLTLQARAAPNLGSFIPFAAQHPIDPESAAAWAAPQTDALLLALTRLEGTCQMVLDLRQTDPAPDRPRDWLLHRAARVTVPDGVLAELAPVTRDIVLNRTADGARLHALIPRCEIAGFGRDVASACRAVAVTGWSAVVSGPWPPLSFHRTVGP